jgi:hypothetical protein
MHLSFRIPEKEQSVKRKEQLEVTELVPINAHLVSACFPDGMPISQD